jgi:hypothetical protein
MTLSLTSLSSLLRRSMRKDDIPASDIQRYCETTLHANGKVIRNSNITSLKAVEKLLV